MAQSTMHTCTQCNAPVPDTMRFCPNCGTPARADNDTSASYAPTQKAPPPPDTAYAQQTPPVYRSAPAQQYQPALQNAQSPPAYAPPQKNSSRRILKVGVILLILLVLLGAGGFFAFRPVSSRGGNAANTGAQSDVTPTRTSLTTTPINTTVTYASVTIAILNAQQATSFADDTNTSAQGVVRLNLHAVQSAVNNVYFTSAPAFAYPESFVLLLPGGSK
ncbi:MAG TPA: zinc ribbon domain-containing protein, partial [Ktedonobacteraceae bacterium]|nr:zinc ribbon domain-containing protein [Ktedonobacteraceae bacterium]